MCPEVCTADYYAALGEDVQAGCRARDTDRQRDLSDDGGFDFGECSGRGCRKEVDFAWLETGQTGDFARQCEFECVDRDDLRDDTDDFGSVGRIGLGFFVRAVEGVNPDCLTDREAVCDLRDDVCRPAACTACTAGESPFRGAAVVDRSERGACLECKCSACACDNLVGCSACLVPDSDIGRAGVHKDVVASVFGIRDFVEVRSCSDSLDDFFVGRRSQYACRDRGSCTCYFKRS